MIRVSAWKTASIRRHTGAGAILAALVALANTARAVDPFEFMTIANPGRTAAAELADFDGDGRVDLLSVSFTEMPPDEAREVRLHFQRPDGSLPSAPDWVGALPTGAAVYDIADLPDSPGSDLLLLTRRGVTVLSFSGKTARRRDIAIEGPALIAVAADERGLDRITMARTDLGPEIRLLIPGFLECVILTPEGEVVSRLEISGRANYFMPPRPGPLISGSEIEIHFDHPRLNAGDVNGDGRVDLVAADRHEIQVFNQREDGSFPRHADQSVAVGRVSERDHILSSGNLAIDLQDLNGDGRADLLISQTQGGLFKARSENRIHLNRDGSWDLESPDQVFTNENGMATVQLLDLDGDGLVELIDGRIPMGTLQLVELLLTKDIDAEVAVYRAKKGGLFHETPWFTRSLEIAFNFDTSRPMGFFPNYKADLNDDGHKDLLTSGKGNEIEVYLGGTDHYRKRVVRQKADSSGRLRFGDLDGNGLTDLLMYDPLRPDSPIRIGINRGTLPKALPAVSMPRSEDPDPEPAFSAANEKAH
jgi:hypothetical protein